MRHSLTAEIETRLRKIISSGEKSLLSKLWLMKHYFPKSDIVRPPTVNKLILYWPLFLRFISCSTPLMRLTHVALHFTTLHYTAQHYTTLLIKAKYCMPYTVCHSFLWLFCLAPSNPGLQELNNLIRNGQLWVLIKVFQRSSR